MDILAIIIGIFLLGFICGVYAENADKRLNNLKNKGTR